MKLGNLYNRNLKKIEKKRKKEIDQIKCFLIEAFKKEETIFVSFNFANGKSGENTIKAINEIVCYSYDFSSNLQMYPVFQKHVFENWNSKDWQSLIDSFKKAGFYVFFIEKSLGTVTQGNNTVKHVQYSLDFIPKKLRKNEFVIKRYGKEEIPTDDLGQKIAALFSKN